MSANVLESILSHQPLEVSILFHNMCSVQVVDVGALHTESNVNLATAEEGSPPLDGERDTLVLSSVFLAHLVEPNLLDDLQPEHRAAPLAMGLQLHGYHVTHHRLQAHCLASEGQPHFSELLNVVCCYLWR